MSAGKRTGVRSAAQNANNIIQKQIDVILTSGVPVKPVVIPFNSFLHLGKILLYVFLIYVQSLYSPQSS